MSVSCMGGVWSCGPADQTSMIVLLAIADQADDFGFAVVAHETIAAKSRCSVRTVIRQIDQLESDQWLYVGRKMWNGKANVYFVNIEKIGVSVSPKSVMSPWHVQLRKAKGDKLSRIFLPRNSGDTKEFSGDNPQPPQVTPVQAQVTKSPVSGDTGVTPSIKNHHYPSRTINDVEPVTPTPMRGELSDAECFARMLEELKSDLGTPPKTLQQARNFAQLVHGQNDFDTAFRDWWFEDLERWKGGVIIGTQATDEDATARGIAKYSSRLEHLARKHFGIGNMVAIHFVFRNCEKRGDRGHTPE